MEDTDQPLPPTANPPTTSLKGKILTDSSVSNLTTMLICVLRQDSSLRGSMESGMEEHNCLQLLAMKKKKKSVFPYLWC